MSNQNDQNTRTEHDSMGELQVPGWAHWGAQTQRAVNNFPISGLPVPRPFIRALGLIKGAAAAVNHDLGLLDAEPCALEQATQLWLAPLAPAAQHAHLEKGNC